MTCTFEYTDERHLSVWKVSGAAHGARQPRDMKRGSPAMTQVQKGGGRMASRMSVQGRSRVNGESLEC